MEDPEHTLHEEEDEEDEESTEGSDEADEEDEVEDSANESENFVAQQSADSAKSDLPPEEPLHAQEAGEATEVDELEEMMMQQAKKECELEERLRRDRRERAPRGRREYCEEECEEAFFSDEDDDCGQQTCSSEGSASGSAPAQPGKSNVDYLELFGLAATVVEREKVLSAMVPHTEDHYYFHVLHYQNTGRFTEAQKLLAKWKKSPFGTSLRFARAQTRQLLYVCSETDTSSVEPLIDALGLDFKAEPVIEAPANTELPDLPFSLGSNAITTEAFIAKRASPHVGAIEWMVASGMDLITNPWPGKHALQQLRRPDVPNLVETLAKLTVDDICKLEVFQALSLAQLEDLATRKSELNTKPNFIVCKIKKLSPSVSPGEDWVATEDALFVRRVWEYVATLDDQFLQPKHDALVHVLRTSTTRGEYPIDSFRQLSEIIKKQKKPGKQISVSLPLGLGSTGDRNQLIRDYLLELMKDLPNFSEFEHLLPENQVKYLFYESKLIHNVAPVDKWASMHPPTQLENIKGRVDLFFARQNRRDFGVSEPVELHLFVKNIEKLIVKVYNINALNCYLRNPSSPAEIGTGLDLDGLVPNKEYLFTYESPPLHRILRSFTFPELDGQRGVWVIDFIGNGKSSRALIRKGWLRCTQVLTTQGHEVTVYDDNNDIVTAANLHVGTTKYSADARGTVQIPYATHSGGTSSVVVILEDSSRRLASLARFHYHSEQFAMQAGFHVERETLIAGAEALLAVRATPQINGLSLPLSVVTEATLTLTLRDSEKTATRTTPFTLTENQESLHSFTVPAGLRSISVQLEVTLALGDREETRVLTASGEFKINGIDSSAQVADMHLRYVDNTYRIYVLGKGGEPRPFRQIIVRLGHRDFKDPIEFTLQSDTHGVVILGELECITAVEAREPTLSIDRKWVLPQARVTLPSTLYIVVGDVLRIPYPRLPGETSAFSLLEAVNDSYVADHTNRIHLQEGFIEIHDLPPGYFSLLLRHLCTTITINVIKGTRAGETVLASHGQVHLGTQEALQIAKVDTDADFVRVKLQNWDTTTRVHISSSHFLPAFDSYRGLGQLQIRPPYLTERLTAHSAYVSGRDIGDEYRYVIDRKYCPKFPGMLLETPALLLVPVVVGDTRSDADALKGGEGWDDDGQQPTASTHAGFTYGTTGSVSETCPASLEFKKDTPIVIYNLLPDANGVVTISRKQHNFSCHQHIHILAINGLHSAYQHFTFPSATVEQLLTKTVGLTAGLNPAHHLAVHRNVSLLYNGDTLTIADAKTSTVAVYDSLQSVYSLFQQLREGDGALTTFQFVLEWPSLAENAKRVIYSRCASHELNFFIAKRDPAFFDQVVRPFISSKFRLDFFDKYLLGLDLSEYGEIYQISNLNSVERILQAEARKTSLQSLATRMRVRGSTATQAVALFVRALQGTEKFQRQRKAKEKEEESRHRYEYDEDDDSPSSPTRARGAGAARSVPAASYQYSRAKSKKEEKRSYAPRRSFRPVDLTKVQAETTYYRTNGERPIADSPFWADYAEWLAGDKAKQFLSQHVAEAANSFTEAVLALSILGLPFNAPQQLTGVPQGPSITYAAATPAIVFHQELLPVEEATTSGDKPLLLRQEVVEMQTNQVRTLADEFLWGVPYQCKVILTNPSNAPIEVQVLAQIPETAIPILSSPFTTNKSISVTNYGTQVINYAFYFPKPATAAPFVHYPAHVVHEGRVIAFAPPFTFNVVASPSHVDTKSWAYISQQASAEDVLRYLATADLTSVNLSLICWRMKGKDFFISATKVLEDRGRFEAPLWAYGFLHRHFPTMRQYLLFRGNEITTAGKFVDCPLIPARINEVGPNRTRYAHKDFSPLINVRTHPLGSSNAILNNKLAEQFHNLLEVLCLKNAFDSFDLLSISYYLLLRNRISEAISTFRLIPQPEELTPLSLQYDHFAAYLAVLQTDLERAKAIARKHQNHPVARWAKLFTTMLQHISEAEAAEGPAAAETMPSDTAGSTDKTTFLEFAAVEGQVSIRHQGVAEVVLNCYKMDLELLFSTNPFVTQDLSRFSIIQPNVSLPIRLAEQSTTSVTTTVVSIPSELGAENVFMELLGAGHRCVQASYANVLNVLLNERRGLLYVRKRADGKPVPISYVKVYAQTKDGTTRFYKDGYTDLRGVFDFVKLSTNELEEVSRFAILVNTQDFGSVVREAQPPPQVPSTSIAPVSVNRQHQKSWARSKKKEYEKWMDDDSDGLE